jgi:hypothetical protein
VTTTSAASDLLGALNELLSAEHAAVYGYGLVGAHLTQSEESASTAAFVTHENRRDVIRRLILDRSGTPVSALPAYRPKKAVVNRTSALQLAVALEEDCAGACIAVLSMTDNQSLRRSAAGWLSDAAVRDELWRARLGPRFLVAAPPLPGLAAPVTPTATPS